MPEWVKWNDKFPPLNLWNFPIKMISEIDIKDYGEAGHPQPKTSTGIKYDSEKPRMDLLDADFLEGVAKVLTFGAVKYSANNWRGGINYSRLIASIYRHLGAINRGEDVDPESGLPHALHIGCNAMFLSSMMQTRKDLDDRYKKV